MIIRSIIGIRPLCLAAGAILGFTAVQSLNAATAPSLAGQLLTRPLTPQEIKDYTITGAQGASGLGTVGVGQPSYLEALISKAVNPTNLIGVTWELKTAPVGSKAVLLDSPLTAKVPPYKMIDRESAQVIGRKMLRPDVLGSYTVVAKIETSVGTTNITQNITAANYLGAMTCAYCHSGGVVAENTYVGWQKTGHATFFTRAIDGKASDHYAAYCISCHTVGYDANTNAVNGGFDDIAKAVGWTFPTNVVNTNWAMMPKQLQTLGNIQCENCHGPGSEHAYSLGDTSKISASLMSGDCAQCHDAKPNHIKNAEWNASKHAVAVEETEASCSRCHTAKGYVNYIAGAPAVAVPNDQITCATCHDPHDATNPHQIRTKGSVALMDNKTTITEGGNGLMCMNCHMARRNAATYVETTPGSNRFGPHHGPQADMLAGANAITYGKTIGSTAHLSAVEDSCATCHMQSVANTNSAYLHAGGHTFSMSAETTNGVVQLTGACKECHGDIKTFDIARQDYDGNGIVEGVQTEVRHLLDRLAFMLPPVGTPKTSLSINTNWTKPQLKAGYNYLFVLEDGSFGVHNAAYAVGLLKASIADLSGDANSDGLPDWWQTQYFGSITNPQAHPNAMPAGDGVPNWLKFGLGLDPMKPGMVLPDGVAWANAGTVGGAGSSPVQIYTAAEVVFNTEMGKTYQLQAISSLGDGWKNIGGSVTGTGAAMSFVTPTRGNQQQFYRVVTQ